MTEAPAGAGTGPASSPRCYRHPDRETHVRCVRCDRPICPDCMIPASVGFQCPECVRAGNRDVREARTVFGGRVAAGRQPLTLVLIGLNVLVYVAQLASDRVTSDLLQVTGFPGLFGVADGEYYRLLTAAFLHDPGSPIHILLNMYALYVLGPDLESLLGRLRFGALYLLSALGGSVAAYLFAPPLQGGLGASGAIFGLLGATIVITRRMRRSASFLYGLLAVNLVLGLVIPRIDWRAHLGGLVVGAVLAAVLAYAPARRRAEWQAAGMALVAAVLVGIVVLRTLALR